MGGCAAVLGLSAERAPSHDPPSHLSRYPRCPTHLPPLTPVTFYLHLPSHPQPSSHSAVFRAVRPLPAPPSLAALWAEGRLLKTRLDLPFLGAKEAGGTPDSTSGKEAFLMAVVPPGYWEVGLAPWMLNPTEGIPLPHSRGTLFLAFSTDC